MIFKDQYAVSFWQKLIFSSFILITILVCVQSMFPNISLLNSSIIQFLETGNFFRRILIASILIIYFFRLQLIVWIFQKRKWAWLEAIIISLVMPLGLNAFTFWGGSNSSPIGMSEIIGVFLYLSGSYINTQSEFERHIWKMKAENKGHLYTKGLFKYSMHINYFGDIVLFTGFAMVTHRIWSFAIPFVMMTNFIFCIIPLLDRYLEKKYGVEFTEYARKTKKFIPLIY
jgi:steroid 5-alpha reductase family enzyme